MCRDKIIIWAFIALCHHVSAQERKSDISSLTKAYQRNPTHQAAFDLGFAYHKAQEHTKAIIYLSKATLKNVEPALASNAYLYRGISRLAEKKYSDAYADFRRSLALNPKNADVYRQRGMAEISSGEYIKAVQDISAYTMYAEKSWEMYNTLANDIIASGTTNTDLIAKAQDLALLSAEKNKNETNERTLQAASVILEKNSAVNDHVSASRELSTPDAAQTSIERKAIEVKINNDGKNNQKSLVAENKKDNKMRDDKKTSNKKDETNQKSPPVKPEHTVIIASNTPPSNKASALEVPDFGKIRRAKVWAVIVGVSKYTTTKSLNLKYANTDAESFYEFLRSSAGGNIPAEQISLITNEKATRTEILKAMKSTFGKAYDSDVIILYMASHGQTENGEFYFLTTEAEPGYLDATALSRSSVADAFNNKSIRAKKKLVFADACHSGELMKAELGARGNDESMELEKSNQLLVEMAQANEGCAIMTASTGGQKSYEDEKWGGGHGIFTYSLIEGLKGNADYDGNKIVTLNEINEYVFRNVTEATQRKQQPSFQGTFDDTFPMSVVIN